MVTVADSHEPHAEIRDALDVAADVLGVGICWFYRGGFHFRLASDWTVSITPETAGRYRIETWRLLRLRDKKWARTGDSNRLTHLIREARETALQPA